MVPEVADKLQQCFQALTSGLQDSDMPRMVSGEEDERAAGNVVDWGKLQSLIDELGGERGLSKLIERPDVDVFAVCTCFSLLFWLLSMFLNAVRAFRGVLEPRMPSL